MPYINKTTNIHQDTLPKSPTIFIGLQLENGGDRVDRSNMNKSLLQIQQEKLEKLMERVDVPLEDEMREIREFRPARKIGRN